MSIGDIIGLTGALILFGAFLYFGYRMAKEPKHSHK